MVNAAPEMARTFEAVLIRQCAPTLAGLKPGSLFCVRPSAPEAMRQTVRQWDSTLKPLGLSVQILLERSGSGTMIVYVYRRTHLEQSLSGRDCRQFLERMGYPSAGVDRQLAQLADRLRTSPEFPHEIGVFLGYPLQDVTGFIENHGQNFTCCGFWKSYGDPVEIQACFERYRRCIHTYITLFEQGIPIEKLAVSA